MRRFAAALLAFSLALAPGFLGAEDSPQKPPELPKSDGSVGTNAPDTEEGPSSNSKVETPEGEPGQEKLSITHETHSRFRLGNFVLGALGGALLGGVAAFLFFGQGSNGSLDYDRVHTVVPIGAGGGAVVGGVLSLFLGATSPEEPVPPAEGLLPRPLGPRLALNLKF
jgi:hypothetical protein